MSKDKYNKYSTGVRIIAFICAGIIGLSMTIPFLVGK